MKTRIWVKGIETGPGGYIIVTGEGNIFKQVTIEWQRSFGDLPHIDEEILIDFEHINPREKKEKTS